MKITLLNQKGGVGKTTVSLLLAAVLREAGRSVAIDDRDPQKSATFFAEQFGLPLLNDSPKSDFIFTDTPGHLRIEGKTETELAKLIKESDTLILVTEKSPASMHGSAPMARFIKKHKTRKSKAYVLFNQVRRSTVVGRSDGKELGAALGLPALENELPLSSAFENALIGGYRAVTGKHRRELLTLALEIVT